MVLVRIAAPSGADSASLQAKIDSGADVCAVPEHLVAELALPPVRAVRAAGFQGELREVVVFRVDLSLGDWAFPRVEAIATRRSYVIVGRNVLRQLLVRLDGPRAQLDLLRPSLPRKRGGRARDPRG
jgi:hypothetical protein